MNCYFEEGEVFTWIRDRERSGENMVVSLKMLKECHRTGSKQAMIAEDIRLNLIIDQIIRLINGLIPEFLINHRIKFPVCFFVVCVLCNI